jgi:enamine deaminase RidA (YjgF/YER057c/UK114 family)
MTGKIHKRLAELAIELPARPTPVANYVPSMQSENLIFVSGQLPFLPGLAERFTGVVGDSISTEEGRAAARAAAINVIAVIEAALAGELDRVVRVVKVTGFVNAANGFTEHPEVVNGASDLFVEVFGDAGRHARAAVGVGSLPRGAAVEVEAIFEVA